MFNFLKNNNLNGVGINLRLENIDTILKEQPKFEYLEIIADNWLSNGPHHKKLESLRQNYEILFHTVGMNIGGIDPIDTNYINEILELKQKFQPKHVSDHLCFQANNNFKHHDLLPIPYNKESLKNVEQRINIIQDKLKEEILVENLSYYLEFKSSFYTESQFLNSLNKKTGCYFLLDLNNIWTNEKNLEINSQNFIEELNIKAVKEIHIAGSEQQGDFYIDNHGESPKSEVLSLLKAIKENALNVPVIYERDQNLINLKESVKQLKGIKKCLR